MTSTLILNKQIDQIVYDVNDLKMAIDDNKNFVISKLNEQNYELTSQIQDLKSKINQLDLREK